MDDQPEEAPEQEFVAFDLERLSSCAREALAAAKIEARKLGDRFVCTEHVLLGLSQTESGAAYQVLQAIRLTSDRVADTMRFIRGRQSEQSDNDADQGFSPRLHRVLALASKEAADRGDREVGTIHVLLGLLRVREGLPAFLLESAGLGPKRVDFMIDRAYGSRWEDRDSADEGGRAPSVSPAPTA
jgi:ATP-dependent Clp protease ATP-binding subunit ClpC